MTHSDGTMQLLKCAECAIIECQLLQRTTILSYNPLQGVLLHGAGGFAAGSFYAPLKKVKGWAWESSWLAMGVVAWAVTPWIWYFQFFLYGMGTTKLGETYDFSSWSLHMAFIVVFSNLWGLYFREWRGCSRTTKTMVWIGIATLIISTTIIGYGNYLAGD